MSTLLTATDLTKRFRSGAMENTVLQGVNLAVSEGEFVAVMGPSGSGKSTLLYCLSGMDSFDAGAVSFAGTDLGTLSEDERAALRGRSMGFVFQDPNLIQALTVLDNILLAASLQGLEPPGQLLARAHELLQVTGLEGLAERGVDQLSGGQRQRVSLCRALLHRPAVLFGDEPTGSLNARSSAEMVALLERMNAAGTTMLIVTHDPRVAAHASRVLFLADGSVASDMRFDRKLGPAERQRAVADSMLQLGI